MPFTAAQESAIKARNRELLVSAAAGSGKTKVLIERIFSLIQEDGYSVERMLVVTFTHAAASEMRDRLETRLGEAAITDPKMQRQAELVETAQISTLHSFCQKIVREHFEAAGIDPQAVLCDEVLRGNLLSSSMEDALTAAYEEAAEQPNLRALLAKFSGREILDMLSSLYAFLMAQPQPFLWLNACASHAYSMEDLSHGPMAETLLADCRILLDGALALWREAELLGNDPFCREGYQENIRRDGELLLALSSAAQESLPALIERVSAASFSTLSRYSLTDPAEMNIRDRLKDLRERYKGFVADIKKLLPEDPCHAIADLRSMQPALEGLSELTQKMHTLFMERKNERGVLDFNDLEHMALGILTQPSLQKSIAARYDAIFVDEYQDISGIQEAILQSLQRREESSASLPFLCFYVGDVKQSIYRFRQADPTLFMDKQRRFSFQKDAPQRKISLNHNFRSRETVLNAVNRVFFHVMREDVTEITYDDEAALHPGLPSLGDPAVELHLLNGDGMRAADYPRMEASLIAQEISRVVNTPMPDREGRDGGALHYRDIAILLPAAKGIADIVENTLTQVGIPVYCEDGRGSMESEEIRQALAHLWLMSNLMDDLHLLAALRGPIYQMTEEELAQIRLCKTEKGASFLEAMLAASEQVDSPLSYRCRAILDDLRQERFLQRSMPLDEYLWDFLSRSGMYGFYGAQPGGKLRQANLRMLCHRASDHVQNRGGDLQDFLESVTATGSVKDARSPTVLSPWEDVVRIMTIHKSKGLEFPMVFVMGLGGALHRRRESGLVSLHPMLGVALRYVNEDARTKRATLLGNAIGLRVRAEEKAERARVLYVAMTRARERLVLLGTSSSLAKEAPSVSGNPSATSIENTAGGAYAVWEAKSMLEWIWQSCQNTDEIKVCNDLAFSTSCLWETQNKTALSTKSTFFPHKKGVWRVVFHNEVDESSLCDMDKGEANFDKALEDIAAPSTLKSLLETVLPKAPMASDEIPQNDPIAPAFQFLHAPLKLGVTAYCRSLEEASVPEPVSVEVDAESVETKRLPLTRPRLLSDLPRLPAYLRGSKEQTALLRGVATHKALSLLPMEPLRKISSTSLSVAIAEELNTMLNEGILTREEGELIDAIILARFFASELGQRTLASHEVHREWSFNLYQPELCESLLQGMIDLCFLEEDEWVLVDYKTDRVSDAQELWGTYGRQIDLYGKALAKATGKPVREATLFALRLGEGATHRQA